MPYLQETVPEAAPQCISGRTSYLRVRLAFHLYPQLIQCLCTDKWFGPPPRYYRGFTLAMGSSPGFGSNPSDLRGALFGLAFAMAPQASLLNRATEIHSPAHSSIGTPSSLRQTEGLRRFVGTRFQELLTPLPGCFFTFPSRYCCTIGHWGCLALESGLPSFPRDSTCPVVLKDTGQEGPCSLAYEAVTLFGGPFQGPSARAGLGNFPAATRFGRPVSYNPRRALARAPLPSLRV